MLFLMFSHIMYIVLQFRMFILNMVKVSNNEVNICRSDPCEQKAQASDCSEHLVSNVFFYLTPFYHDSSRAGTLIVFFHYTALQSTVAISACAIPPCIISNRSPEQRLTTGF